MWVEILRKEVGQKGPKQVAHELGVSRTTVDLVCAGKYPGSTRRVEERIKAIYGESGTIHCSILGDITPQSCATAWTRAKKIGMKAGNPETLRLYKTCQTCPTRRVEP